jgi:hypothetical protein
VAEHVAIGLPIGINQLTAHLEIALRRLSVL